MVLECWAIIIILSIVAYMFVRSGRKPWAPVVIPLMLLPFVNIVYSPIGRHIAFHNVQTAHSIRIALYAVSIAAASLWIVILGRRLPSGRSRYAYILSGILFTILLAVIFTIKL